MFLPIGTFDSIAILIITTTFSSWSLFARRRFSFTAFLFVFFVIRNVGTCLFIFIFTARFRLPVGEEFLLEEHDPLVLEHLDQRDSLISVLLEELVDEVFVLLGYLRLERDRLTCLIPGNCLLVSSEGCISVNELVEQDSKRPYIELVIVLPMVDHLGRHVL